MGRHPRRRLISSTSWGTTENRSPTIPKSATSRIGASSFLSIATIVFASGIYYLIVSQVLGYRESREFLAWLGDKEAFMSDMRRYRQLISDTKSLSVEQKDKIAGSLSKGRDDLKSAAGQKTKMFTTVLGTGVGILAGIMPIIESLSDEAEDIKERADAAMGIMGNIRPPRFSMAFGTFAIVELSAMVVLL